MVQSNISLTWALTVLASIFIISIFFLCLCGPWETILEEVRTVNIDIISESDGEDDDDDGDENNDESKHLDDNTDPEKI